MMKKKKMLAAHFLIYQSVRHVRGSCVTVPKIIHNVKPVSILLSVSVFLNTESCIVMRQVPPGVERLA